MNEGARGTVVVIFVAAVVALIAWLTGKLRGPQGEAALTERLPRTSEAVTRDPKGSAVESPASIPKEFHEAHVVINGRPLTVGQVMTLRIALSAFDPDCGDDEHGRFMTRHYTERQHEIFRMFAEGLQPGAFTAVSNHKGENDG